MIYFLGILRLATYWAEGGRVRSGLVGRQVGERGMGCQARIPGQHPSCPFTALYVWQAGEKEWMTSVSAAVTFPPIF